MENLSFLFSCRIILIANVFYFYKVILPNDSIKLMLRCSIEEDLPHPPADIWKYLEIFLVPPAGRGQATAPRGGADTAKCPNTHGIGPHNRNCLSQMSILLKLGKSVNLGVSILAHTGITQESIATCRCPRGPAGPDPGSSQRDFPRG